MQTALWSAQTSADPGLRSLEPLQGIFFVIALMMLIGVLFSTGVYFVALSRFLGSAEKANVWLDKYKNSIYFKTVAYLVPFTLSFVLLRAGDVPFGGLDLLCLLAFYVVPLFIVNVASLGKTVVISEPDHNPIQGHADADGSLEIGTTPFARPNVPLKTGVKPKKNKFLNMRTRIIFVSIWILSSIITYIAGGGFATQFVLESTEGELIRYKEELNRIESINVLNTEDGYVVSICFNALLAYTPESKNYQIDKSFITDFTGWGTRMVPRDKIVQGCKKIEGSVDLLTDAQSKIENSSEPYYRLGGTYCRPGDGYTMLTLGCFVNPKQKWGRIEIALERPKYEYTANSNYLPAAWIVDVVIAPIFAVYYLFNFAMFLF